MAPTRKKVRHNREVQRIIRMSTRERICERKESAEEIGFHFLSPSFFSFIPCPVTSFISNHQDLRTACWCHEPNLDLSWDATSKWQVLWMKFRTPLRWDTIQWCRHLIASCPNVLIVSNCRNLRLLFVSSAILCVRNRLLRCSFSIFLCSLGCCVKIRGRQSWDRVTDINLFVAIAISMDRKQANRWAVDSSICPPVFHHFVMCRSPIASAATRCRKWAQEVQLGVSIPFYLKGGFWCCYATCSSILGNRLT